MQRLFRRLNRVESIGRRLRLAFRVVVIILVVPAIVSIAVMLSNGIRYNAIIAPVSYTHLHPHHHQGA